MINLLPPPYKKELKDEETLKILLILVISFSAFLLVLSLLLLGTQAYLQGALSSKILLAKSFEEELALQSKTQDELKSVSEEILAFSHISRSQISLEKVFQRLFEDLPQDVSLSTFSFSSAKTTPLKGETRKELSQVAIQGSAPNRDVLATLRTNFEQDPFFTGLFFPLSNFTNLANFSLSVKVKSGP